MLHILDYYKVKAMHICYHRFWGETAKPGLAVEARAGVFVGGRTWLGKVGFLRSLGLLAEFIPCSRIHGSCFFKADPWKETKASLLNRWSFTHVVKGRGVPSPSPYSNGEKRVWLSHAHGGGHRCKGVTSRRPKVSLTTLFFDPQIRNSSFHPLLLLILVRAVVSFSAPTSWGHAEQLCGFFMQSSPCQTPGSWPPMPVTYFRTWFCDFESQA